MNHQHAIARDALPYAAYQQQTSTKVARDVWLSAVKQFIEHPTTYYTQATKADLALATFALSPITSLPTYNQGEHAASDAANETLNWIQKCTLRCIHTSNHSLLNHLHDVAKLLGKTLYAFPHKNGFLTQFQKAATEAQRCYQSLHRR